jgi:hypothetical protein
VVFISAKGDRGQFIRNRKVLTDQGAISVPILDLKGNLESTGAILVAQTFKYSCLRRRTITKPRKRGRRNLFLGRFLARMSTTGRTRT